MPVSGVSLSPINGLCCFLDQETFPSLHALSTQLVQGTDSCGIYRIIDLGDHLKRFCYEKPVNCMPNIINYFTMFMNLKLFLFYIMVL